MDLNCGKIDIISLYINIIYSIIFIHNSTQKLETFFTSKQGKNEG